MSTRLVQRPTSDLPAWYVSTVLRRGSTEVEFTGSGAPSQMPCYGRVGLVAWTFAVTGTVPPTGEWTLDCPILSEIPSQALGLLIQEATMVPLHISGGIVAIPALDPTKPFGIQGMVAL
jgi:hypothetical protein